jgi:hypothetical protein
VFGELILPAGVAEAAAVAWANLGRPSRRLNGLERIAIVNAARAAIPRPLWDRNGGLNALRDASGDRGAVLTALAAIFAAEASLIDSSLVAELSAEIGDAAYAETAALVAQVITVDQFCISVGIDVVPFPEFQPGEPSGERPDDMGDAGGHIQMTVPFRGPNVARSLSLAAEDHLRWRSLVLSMYSRDAFDEMVWTDRALTRPQVELLAARTSSLNECFY